MEEWKITAIRFGGTGGSYYSDWKQMPMRFENFVSGVSKSEGLKASLKRLVIKEWGISKEMAKYVVDKFKLKVSLIVDN